MNVLPSLAQESLRQAELMTSVPLCPASKGQRIVLIAKRSSLRGVLPLHIYIHYFKDGIFFLTLLVKLTNA